MGFGNLGIVEIVIIGVIVLVFFGPERLPEIARSVGKGMREFRRGVNEIQRELDASERSGGDERPGRPSGRRAPDPDRVGGPGRPPPASDPPEPPAPEDRAEVGEGRRPEEG